jgi:predicted transcriptional regulator
MAKRAFGELESQILYILKSGERKTVKEVHLALGAKDNYNTVMTVMSRLADKKVLAREKMGLHYEYWILSSAQSFSFLDKIKQKFLGVKPTTLVSYLIENSEDLTDEDLKEMERIIKQARDAKK